MTIHKLCQAAQKWDEILVIGRDVQEGEKLCHIVGMIRKEEEAVLYLLEPEEERADEEEMPFPYYSNRLSFKRSDHSPMFLKGFQVGEQKFEIQSANSGALACNDTAEGCLEETLLLYEMERAGWRLPEGHPFEHESWERLLLTKLEFSLSAEEATHRLPSWENKQVILYLDQKIQPFFVEQPVCISVGKERELNFSLADGRTGVCYINKVYLMDVWEEQEKKFADPRYRERLSEEELEAMKRQFFDVLEENCPKGMCYLGIEYECSLEGNLVFYEKAFLDRRPEEHSGSARMLLMMLRPDEEIGSHNKKLYGCVVQVPLPPDTRQVEVELFQFLQHQKERELIL